MEFIAAGAYDSLYTPGIFTMVLAMELRSAVCNSSVSVMELYHHILRNMQYKWRERLPLHHPTPIHVNLTLSYHRPAGHIVLYRYSPIHAAANHSTAQMKETARQDLITEAGSTRGEGSRIPQSFESSMALPSRKRPRITALDHLQESILKQSRKADPSRAEEVEGNGPFGVEGNPDAYQKTTRHDYDFELDNFLFDKSPAAASSIADPGSPMHCDLCRRTFTNDRLLRSHILMVHRKSYSCDESGCDQAFTNTSDLKRHKQAVHEPPIYCDKPMCIGRRVRLNRADKRKLHEAKYHGPFVCPLAECYRSRHDGSDYGFSTQGELDTHLDGHQRDKQKLATANVTAGEDLAINLRDRTKQDTADVVMGEDNQIQISDTGRG